MSYGRGHKREKSTKREGKDSSKEEKKIVEK